MDPKADIVQAQLIKMLTKRHTPVNLDAQIFE